MIYVIRHGQTEQNHRKLLTGRRDYRLNETGVRQAQEAGQWFQERGIHFDLVYSSPLERAVHTAKLAAPGTELRIDERLIEMEFGPYEGMDLTDPAPEVITFFSDFVHNPAPDGMEPLQAVVDRLGTFLEEIREEENWELVSYTYDLHHDPAMNEGNIMTEYERKFSALGKRIGKLIAVHHKGGK